MYIYIYIYTHIIYITYNTIYIYIYIYIYIGGSDDAPAVPDEPPPADAGHEDHGVRAQGPREGGR